MGKGVFVGNGEGVGVFVVEWGDGFVRVVLRCGGLDDDVGGFGDEFVELSFCGDILDGGYGG